MPFSASHFAIGSFFRRSQQRSVSLTLALVNRRMRPAISGATKRESMCLGLPVAWNWRAFDITSLLHSGSPSAQTSAGRFSGTTTASSTPRCCSHARHRPSWTSVSLYSMRVFDMTWGSFQPRTLTARWDTTVLSRPALNESAHFTPFCSWARSRTRRA
jgi:hypothetical protein